MLEFLATESITTMPEWLEKHRTELAGVTTHQLQIVDGPHYLHWTQSPMLGRAISELVTANVATSPKPR